MIILLSLHRGAEALVSSMLAKYPGTVRTISTPPSCPPYDPTLPQPQALEDPGAGNAVDEDPDAPWNEPGRKKRLAGLLKRYLKTLE